MRVEIFVIGAIILILGLALFSYAEQRANAIAMFAGGYAAFSPDYQNLLREISIGQMLIVIGIVIMIPGIILKKEDSESDEDDDNPSQPSGIDGVRYKFD